MNTDEKRRVKEGVCTCAHALHTIPSTLRGDVSFGKNSATPPTHGFEPRGGPARERGMRRWAAGQGADTQLNSRLLPGEKEALGWLGRKERGRHNDVQEQSALAGSVITE